MAGITAAVVGVIANLGVYFAVHTIFATTNDFAWGPIRLQLPELASWKPVATAIGAVAFLLIFLLKWSVPRTLIVCALLGVGAALVGLPVS